MKQKSKMIFYLIYIGLISIFNDQQVNGEILSCKDENEQDVDWVVVHKKPHINRRLEGQGYLHKSSNDQTDKFSFSNKLITQDKLRNKNSNSLSVIGKILNQVYIDPKLYRYIIYNDVLPLKLKSRSQREYLLGPKETTKKFGTAKGVLIWDDINAIWLVHSVPGFPEILISKSRHSVPDLIYPNRNEFAHSFLCLNIRTSDIEKIMKHLIIIKASVYDTLFDDEDVRKLERAQIELYGFANVNPRIRNPTENFLSSGVIYSEPEKVGRTMSMPRPRTMSISRPRSLSETRTSTKQSNKLFYFKRPKMNQENAKLSTSLTTRKGIKLRIITKSSKENEIWKKVSDIPEFNNQQFHIKSYPKRKISAQPFDISKIMIKKACVTGFEGVDLSWEHTSDQSRFGITYKSPFSYCYSSLDKYSNKNSAGLAICLFDDTSIENLSKAIHKIGTGHC